MKLTSRTARRYTARKPARPANGSDKESICREFCQKHGLSFPFFWQAVGEVHFLTVESLTQALDSLACRAFDQGLEGMWDSKRASDDEDFI
jgi:hypothetical protein